MNKIALVDKEKSVLLSCILQLLKSLSTQAKTIICVKTIKSMAVMWSDIYTGKSSTI